MPPTMLETVHNEAHTCLPGMVKKEENLCAQTVPYCIIWDVYLRLSDRSPFLT